MTEDKDLIDYLLLLRFGTQEPSHETRPILNLTSIAKITRKPISTIRALIKHGQESRK